jgi:hypothetical protein
MISPHIQQGSLLILTAIEITKCAGINSQGDLRVRIKMVWRVGEVTRLFIR